MSISVKYLSRKITDAFFLHEKTGVWINAVQHVETPWTRTQQCWMLHVASVCTSCCMSSSPVQTEATLLDVTILRPFAQYPDACWCVLLCKVWNRLNIWTNNSQHLFCSVISPKRSATMLDPFAQLFQYCLGHALALNVISKVLWVVSNIVGSCYISLHTTANMDATTPIVV